MGRKPDAFLLPGSPLGQPKDGVARDVTIFVSSSTRPKDEEHEVVQRLLAAVSSARTMLQLQTARAVVAFDGLGGKPGVTDAMARAYASKIRRVRTALPAHADVLVHEPWVHQANSLRCAMRALPRTPLVFVSQDDVQIAGPVDAAMLAPLLRASLAPRAATRRGSGGKQADVQVEYVRLSQTADCQADGLLLHTMRPCQAHPTNPWLHTLNRWTNRPHLATRRHYEQRLFARLPRDAKVTPEQVLDQRARSAHAPWPLWSYGQRGEMLRDLHWPVRTADGTLVSKETSNTSGYVHAHLLHAYVGVNQDVLPEQIECHNYRSRNPQWMLKKDGLKV